jgi:hypothetical protein
MRRPPYSAGTLVQIGISALFTTVGLVAVLGSGELVWPTVFFGACTAILVLSPWFERRVRAREDARKDTVEFDDTAVRRRMANGTVESITWDELAAIEIVTTDEGPMADDVFWLLMNRDRSRACAISNDAEGFKPLLARLQALPGFDNAAVIQAMGSTVNARFIVWNRPSG